MNRNLLVLAIALLFLWGCASETPKAKSGWEEIKGRDPEVNEAVYRVRVPDSWERIDAAGSVEDTTKPLAEYRVGRDILVTLHNFPGIKIPPGAQVMRWKRQTAHAKNIHTHLCCRGGFAGIQFESNECLAWAMQLDPNHCQRLSSQSPLHRQMKADYTIKAVGPAQSLTKHRQEILDFASSFELICELPR